MDTRKIDSVIHFSSFLVYFSVISDITYTTQDYANILPLDLFLFVIMALVSFQLLALVFGFYS